MSDDLDDSLRASFLAEDLPVAPDSIPNLIAVLPTTEGPTHHLRSLRSILVAVVAVALIATAAFGLSGLDRAIGGPGSTPSPASSSSSTLGAQPSRTVGEVLAARAAGTLRGETVTIRGYWSAPPVGGHTCTVLPGDHPVALEQVACHEGEYGITELDEVILPPASPQPTPPPSPFQNVGGYWTGPNGPYLTPFVPPDLQERLLGAQMLLSHQPVPIVVSGHFDDPQAVQCDTRARQECEDRFVIEKVISFDPPSAPATPSARPVDTSIEPVSRSHPSADAQAVLQACGAFGDQPYQIARLNAIVGAGLISHARDAARYVPLWGIEPEIQTDHPAWILAFSGRVDIGRGFWADDPICVFIDGVASMFAPGAHGGSAFDPGPHASPDPTLAPPTSPVSQTLALPSLAP